VDCGTLSHEAIAAKAPGLWSRTTRHVAKRKAIYVAVAVAIVAALTGSVLAVRAGHRRTLNEWKGHAETILASEAGVAPLEKQAVTWRGDLLRLRDDESANHGASRLASQALDTVERHARRLEAEASALIEKGTAMGGSALAPSESIFYEGIERMKRAAALIPDDPELARKADVATYWPIVAVEGFHGASGAGPVARVTVEELLGDGSLGLLRELDDAADGSFVQPGTYRITAYERASARFCELSRSLVRKGARTDIKAVFVDSAQVQASMIRIPEMEALVGFEGWKPWMAQRTTRLPSFWIDQYEVTNGDYRRFVEATGATEPRLWEVLPPELRPADFDDLPVLGVHFADAQAYAYWSGKRLPTFREWLLAARGPASFDYPWGNERGDLRANARVAVDVEPETSPELQPRPWNGYRTGVAAVGTTSGDVSPFGLFDCLGNVREWTETPVQSDLQDWPSPVASIFVNASFRIGCGSQWNSAVDVHLAIYMQSNMNSDALGFRCAKSAH
ncbi:MAG: SUMF1/EgtB/PvdO family nonheme iron enzyme, partial [Planctomycetota bacterium]